MWHRRPLKLREYQQQTGSGLDRFWIEVLIFGEYERNFTKPRAPGTLLIERATVLAHIRRRLLEPTKIEREVNCLLLPRGA